MPLQGKADKKQFLRKVRSLAPQLSNYLLGVCSLGRFLRFMRVPPYFCFDSSLLCVAAQNKKNQGRFTSTYPAHVASLRDMHEYALSQKGEDVPRSGHSGE